jgi:alpha-tubulin suppressor-like RCC1 family protein
VMISGLSDIIQLSAGEWHSLFVKNDGTVFSSGRNQYGQLGDGTTVDKSTASLIATLSGVTQAEAGGIHSVFLNSNGSVFACGLNSGGNNDGQLGDGTAIDRHTPVEVAASWGSGTIIRVEATREHSLFLHSDGLLWAAGRNNYGQLGYGKFTTPNSSTPVRSSTVCNALPTSVTAVAQVENEIQVFPNPSSGILYITSERPIVHVEVINIIGGTVFLLSNLNERYSAEIDISDKPSGVYFLRITDLDKRVIAKGILLP